MTSCEQKFGWYRHTHKLFDFDQSIRYTETIPQQWARNLNFYKIEVVDLLNLLGSETSLSSSEHFILWQFDHKSATPQIHHCSFFSWTKKKHFNRTACSCHSIIARVKRKSTENVYNEPKVACHYHFLRILISFKCLKIYRKYRQCWPVCCQTQTVPKWFRFLDSFIDHGISNVRAAEVKPTSTVQSS